MILQSPNWIFALRLWSDKEDVLGEAYMYLLENLHPEQQKKADVVCYTKRSVSVTRQKLVAPKRRLLGILTRLARLHFIDFKLLKEVKR